MLSKNLTFSLASLVMMIAFGFVCFVPSVMADGDVKKTHYDLKVEISAAESMVDVSYKGDDNDIQIATGRDRAERKFTQDKALAIVLLVDFSHVVNLAQPTAADLIDIDDPALANEPKPSGGDFGADDLYVAAYDKEGRSLGVLSLAEVSTENTSISQFRDVGAPGKQFLVRIDESKLKDAYTGRGGPFEIYSLVFFIPKGKGNDLADGVTDAAVSRGIRRYDRVHAVAHFAPDAHQHVNDKSNEFQVDLVDDDQGNPKYNVGVSTDAVTNGSGSGTPGIVAVQSFRERAGLIETGVFDVRIILTEEPRGIDDILKDPKLLIDVMNGSVTKLVKGATLKGAHTFEPKQASELTTDIVSYTTMRNSLAAAGGLPEATGRDNVYHQYFATITPDAGFDGKVTVSIKQFMDNVKPISNVYVPLTPEQRIAVTLTDPQETVRDARVKNETLSVRVKAGADTKIADATAAYKTRQEDILDTVANEIQLANKAYIPAGGYLVLAKDLGKAGIAVSDAKLAKKVTAASQLYNTMGLGLPFPADDLDNFFRNGGTLNLGYADIPAATGSGHDDSAAVAAATHADNTGYAGATTNAYTTGALIINEIMWGLNGTGDPVTGSQYIELHNPGTTAITIDNKEWVITVGSLPTGYTAIDTVSNNPSSGYWKVPGHSGVTVASAAYPVVMALVSMSRVDGATDGTAAASWAASGTATGIGVQSVNLSGRRIGTPGAKNIYQAVPVTPEPEPEPVATVPFATGADIRITEVMIASNGGRLPQWIELANVSGVEVSLSGWSIDIDNDAADVAAENVVAESVNVELGDVTLDKDQVVLVVTRTGRNSGVGTGPDAKGDLREERIVNVQSQVSATDAKYSLLSEIAFKIALLPPQKGGVVERGDVVGNLGMGWELPPMSEGDRSSLIRREGSTGEILGTDAAGWVLASDTGLAGAYVTTFYGDDEDMGTPGYDAGGALPVELSKFGAARDRLTGEVQITWETQSELNNAGFYIKRSQQKTGQFQVVNATIIAGAGTISEKQSYTYTDTTAQPNIVYYYQIEDVSLDGNRQTLTRAHRLKGHIGAAGKATTTWGDLKSSRE